MGKQCKKVNLALVGKFNIWGGKDFRVVGWGGKGLGLVGSQTWRERVRKKWGNLSWNKKRGRGVGANVLCVFLEDRKVGKGSNYEEIFRGKGVSV